MGWASVAEKHRRQDRPKMVKELERRGALKEVAEWIVAYVEKIAANFEELLQNFVKGYGTN